MENPFQLIINKLEEIGSEVKKLRQQLPDSKASANDLIGISEAALLLGLQKSTIYALTSKRNIPHFRRGKQLIFSIQALRLWQTEKAIPTVQATKNNLRIGKGTR